MINTGRFTMHGSNQLETQAQTHDIDAFGYQGGRIVPSSQVSQTAVSRPAFLSAEDIERSKDYVFTSHEYAIIRPGDMIIYGHYPQSSYHAFPEPIKWMVLDVQDGNALLLSRDGLDAMPYDIEGFPIAWRNSKIHRWLNDDFLKSAFTAEERIGIRTTALNNSESRGHSGLWTTSDDDTMVKLFLLSEKEATRYLNVAWGDDRNVASRAMPTEYAKAHGAKMDNTHETADGALSGWWWLRTLGDFHGSAECVSSRGSLDFKGIWDVIACVRPAFWLNLAIYNELK